jgi:hypothetical protein
VAGEILEFQQLEKEGWLADLLQPATPLSPGLARTPGNLASAAAESPGPGEVQSWADQLSRLFDRMSDSLDLGDGEIVLQRADDDSEPLVVIRFSEESRLYLMDNGLEVAKAMIQAGLQAAAVIAEQGEMEVEASSEAPRVLH